MRGILEDSRKGIFGLGFFYFSCIIEKMKGSMDFSRKNIIRAAAILVLLGCTFFANFYAVRMMQRYGVDVYFYDKLLVAYNIGGLPGLKVELEKIRSTDSFPREAALAEKFELKLKGLNNPGDFLGAKVSLNKKKIYLFRGLRSAAIALMALIFAWQLAVNFIAYRKARRSGNEK